MIWMGVMEVGRESMVAWSLTGNDEWVTPETSQVMVPSRAVKMRVRVRWLSGIGWIEMSPTMPFHVDWVWLP